MLHQEIQRLRIYVWQVTGDDEPVHAGILIHCGQDSGDRTDVFVAIDYLLEPASFRLGLLIKASGDKHAITNVSEQPGNVLELALAIAYEQGLVASHTATFTTGKKQSVYGAIRHG